MVLAVVPAMSATICGRDAAQTTLSFTKGDSIKVESTPEACAALATLLSGRPPLDSAENFDRRWTTALSLFSPPSAEVDGARALYEARWDMKGTSAPQPPVDALHADNARIGDNAKRLATALGPMRGGDDSTLGNVPNGTQIVLTGRPPSSGDTPETIAARLSTQRYSTIPMKVRDVPRADAFNALGSPDVAPEPSLTDRASHLVDKYSGKESRVITQTLASVRQMAGTLSPDELQRISGLDNSETGSAERFAAWLADLQPSQAPPISYAVLKKGQLGMTDPRTGEITLNHSLLNEPPNAQAAVLAHELYHHWDLKVSANFHEETSNYGGYVAPENVPALEYVPYALTKAFANHASVEQSTPLLSDLQKIPDDPDALKAYVQKVVAQENPK